MTIVGHKTLRVQDFQPDGWATLIRNTSGWPACVPRDLPPAISFDTPLIGLLSTADRALGTLAGITRALPNPRLLIRSFIRREAVLSSRIEGTVASLSDLYLFEMNPEQEERVPDVREVANYVAALDHGVDRLRHAPFSLGLVKELHAILMRGVRGSDKSPGDFRKRQNFISPTERLDDATYVPPPHEQVLGLLESLEVFIQSESELPLLVRLALVHYQFEAIHPFEDGNGRVGRLLISLLLERERALPEPLLYLSAYFERHRRTYYDLLLGVSQRGDWSAWLAFFLRGVADEAIDGVERSRQLFDLRDNWSNLFHKARTSALLLKLIDLLFNTPYIDAAHAARALDVNHQSAQSNIEQLVAQGILREITGQRRNRVYAAPAILAILESQPAVEIAPTPASPLSPGEQP